MTVPTNFYDKKVTVLKGQCNESYDLSTIENRRTEVDYESNYSILSNNFLGNTISYNSPAGSKNNTILTNNSNRLKNPLSVFKTLETLQTLPSETYRNKIMRKRPELLENKKRMSSNSYFQNSTPVMHEKNVVMQQSPNIYREKSVVVQQSPSILQEKSSTRQQSLNGSNYRSNYSPMANKMAGVTSLMYKAPLQNSPLLRRTP